MNNRTKSKSLFSVYLHDSIVNDVYAANNIESDCGISEKNTDMHSVVVYGTPSSSKEIIQNKRTHKKGQGLSKNNKNCFIKWCAEM